MQKKETMFSMHKNTLLSVQKKETMFSMHKNTLFSKLKKEHSSVYKKHFLVYANERNTVFYAE